MKRRFLMPFFTEVDVVRCIPPLAKSICPASIFSASIWKKRRYQEGMQSFSACWNAATRRCLQI